MNGNDDIASDVYELDAYIDGELGDEAAQRVAARLAGDKAAADYVAAGCKLNQALQLNARRIDQQPVSAGLLQTLDRLKPKAEVIPLADRILARRSLQAMAAGLCMLAIGYGSGYYSAGQQSVKQSIALQQIRQEVREEVQRAMNNALEYRPSGEHVNWKSQNGKASAELIPVRTFRAADKSYCREFREVIVIEGVREQRRGLACRAGREDWKTRMLLAEDTPSSIF